MEEFKSYILNFMLNNGFYVFCAKIVPLLYINGFHYWINFLASNIITFDL